MDERDACGLVAIARKDGRPDACGLGEAIEGMRRMSHRSGTVAGEGDGAGVPPDVPLSRHTAVYKLRGGPDALLPYFDDLRHERFATSMAFGHDRYATNTSTSFERVQPFAAFAHNGEIDTIGRLREEALSLRLPLSRDGSDSQDVDAILRALVLRSRL